MGDNHVWFTLRRREQGALRTLIDTLQTEHDSRGPIRGAGTASRVEQDLRAAGGDQ